MVKQEEGVCLYVKDILTLNGTTRAVAVYNPTDDEHNFELKMSDMDLDGMVEVRDVFAHEDLPNITNGTMNVNVPCHDTRIFILNAERRKPRTTYEAETAWLERFQCLGINNSLGYANYADSDICSGGAKVEWLGNNKDNYMEWRNIFCPKGGTYNITLNYLSDEDRSVFCSVNGGKDFEIKTPGDSKNTVKTVSRKIRLKKGTNTIRIGNANAWCPDIDKITIVRM